MRGWNARDSLADMKPDDAVSLDNWIPGFGSITTRRGFASHSTGLGSEVEFMAEFNAGGTRKMISGANGELWDTTSSGAAVSLASGFTSDRWVASQFDDFAGGSRMGLVAKGNNPQIYNGSTVSAMTISGAGLTPSNLGGIYSFKGRTYFWDPDTQDFWYSSVGALGGTLTKFPLGRVQGTGGNLVAVSGWSRDAGNGPDDFLVFLLSSGDVLVYAGSNPGDPADWALVGVYSLGVPISARGLKKVGADVVVLTRSGYVPLESVLHTGRYAENAYTISNRIQGAAVAATRDYGDSFGWDILYYPRRALLIINVPVSAVEYNQHVMNVDTKAWCRFTGIPSVSWCLLNEEPYFGGTDGVVYKFDGEEVYDDNGVPINVDASCAWDYLGTKRATKRVTAIKPIVLTRGQSAELAVFCGFDYLDYIRRGTLITAAPNSGSSWDTADWDTAEWGGDFGTTQTWVGVNGSGYATSIRLSGQISDQSLEWIATHVQVETGGPL